MGEAHKLFDTCILVSTRGGLLLRLKALLHYSFLTNSSMKITEKQIGYSQFLLIGAKDALKASGNEKEVEGVQRVLDILQRARA